MLLRRRGVLGLLLCREGGGLERRLCIELGFGWVESMEGLVERVCVGFAWGVVDLGEGCKIREEGWKSSIGTAHIMS